MKDSRPTLRTLGEGLKYLLILSVILLVWCASFFLVTHSQWKAIVNPGDLATILFGASSIALFIFSSMIAILAIFGWQSIQGAVRDLAKKEAEAVYKGLADEYKGRVNSALGYILGETNKSDPKNSDKIAEAVQLCQQGYDSLKKVGGAGMYMALNNLVFYGSIQNDKAKIDFLLKSAYELKEVAQEHDAPQLLLTACGAILQYEMRDLEKRKDARKILVELQRRKSLSDSQRQEASQYLSNRGYR